MTPLSWPDHMHDGVGVYALGEERDFIVAFGHIEPDRFLAAVNDYLSRSWRGPLPYPIPVQHLQARFVPAADEHPADDGDDLIEDAGGDDNFCLDWHDPDNAPGRLVQITLATP